MSNLEEVIIKMKHIDAQTKREWDETLPSLFSKGIYRTQEWDGNIDDNWYTDHVVFRDYNRNNLIYAWLTDREDGYPSRTASAVMEYLDLNVFGDVTMDIQYMLENERDTVVYVDCLGGLSPEIHFVDNHVSKNGIDIRGMEDSEIIRLLTGNTYEAAV